MNRYSMKDESVLSTLHLMDDVTLANLLRERCLEVFQKYNASDFSEAYVLWYIGSSIDGLEKSPQLEELRKAVDMYLHTCHLLNTNTVE